MAMLICGKGMHHIATANSSTNMKKLDDRENSRKNHCLTFKGKSLAIFLILTNVPVALYTGLIHQRGTLDVMRALGGSIADESNASILFLMPCHSTPHYRYEIVKP
jgi:phosphatidylinositol glycan class B